MRLGQSVGKQPVLMLSNRIVSVQRRHDIHRNQTGTLVQQLVISVLAVGTYTTPNHRASLPVNTLAFWRNTLAVTLHIHLLQMARESIQIAGIAQNCMALGTKEVTVPNAQQPHHDWHIVSQLGGTKMLIHSVSTS